MISVSKFRSVLTIWTSDINKFHVKVLKCFILFWKKQRFFFTFLFCFCGCQLLKICSEYFWYVYFVITVFSIRSTVYLLVNINTITVPRSAAIIWAFTLYHTDGKGNLFWCCGDQWTCKTRIPTYSKNGLCQNSKEKRFGKLLISDHIHLYHVWTNILEK